jgi:hypothetical protein
MHNKISMPIINGIDGSAWVDVSDYSFFPGMARESAWIWLTFMGKNEFLSSSKLASWQNSCKQVVKAAEMECLR